MSALLLAGWVWAQEPPDRSAPPPVAPATWMALDEPAVHRLSEAVEVRLVEVPGVRRVEIYAVLHRGYHDLGGRRTATMDTMGALVGAATEARDVDAMEAALDLHDVTIYAFLHPHAGGLSLTAPREELAFAVGLLDEVLHRPAFPPREVRVWRNERKLDLTLWSPSDLREASSAALGFATLPVDHPYANRPDLDAIRAVRSREVAALYHRWLRTSPVTLVAVGDVAWSDLEPLLAPVFEGLGAPGTQEPALAVPAPPRQALGVHFEGQQQASVRLQMAMPARDDPDRVAVELAAFALGGHFLSRLNANLREDKGLTYGTRATYSPEQTAGILRVRVDVKGSDVGVAVTEIERELTALARDGVTDKELEMALRADAFDWNETRRDAATALRFYGRRLWELETVADARSRSARAEALDRAAVSAVAARWFDPGADRVWVVAGDRDVVAPQLELLGWDVTWVEPSAAILGAF